MLLIPQTLAQNFYYLLLVAPAIAALAGLALTSLARDRGSSPLLALVLVLFAIDTIRFALPLYAHDRAPIDLGHLLNQLTAPDDLIATQSGGSPDVLYAADRRGWLGETYDLARLEHIAQKGASYYASAFPFSSEQRRNLLPALDARFQRLSADDAYWPIYFLGTSTGLLHDVPKEEIRNPYLVVFADQVELLGISLRQLLDWPTSFEVIYYWRCVNKPDTDLRVFVHITTPSGQTVFQEDHWPLAGHFPTTRWAVGDVIRERYVVVLPNWLPAGTYQLRLGWYDPETGRRLPIVSPSTSDGEDRARVAKIEVRRPPTYRWFSVEY